jgi:acyl phosphate:glycerol-3-phosphate acyltransferase
MDTYTLSAILVVIVSYLLGSVPTAYLAAKFNRVDIFSIGSGNMGATNVVRALGCAWGIGVLLLDIGKGIAAIYISRQIMGDSKAAATTISAISVIVGHNWSLFATLLTGTIRGGKGAATAFGTLVMIAPLHILVIMTLLAGLVVAITRYVSLAVLMAFSLAMVWLFVLIVQQELESGFLIYLLLLTALMLVRFKGNIQRLLEGTERRFGEHT